MQLDRADKDRLHVHTGLRKWLRASVIHVHTSLTNHVPRPLYIHTHTFLLSGFQSLDHLLTSCPPLLFPSSPSQLSTLTELTNSPTTTVMGRLASTWPDGGGVSEAWCKREVWSSIYSLYCNISSPYWKHTHKDSYLAPLCFFSDKMWSLTVCIWLWGHAACNIKIELQSRSDKRERGERVESWPLGGVPWSPLHYSYLGMNV